MLDVDLVLNFIIYIYKDIYNIYICTYIQIYLMNIMNLINGCYYMLLVHV